MGLLRRKEETPLLLPQSEHIITSWDSPIPNPEKEGKTIKGKVIITNERILFVDRKTNAITASMDIATIDSISVSDRRQHGSFTSSSSSSNYGSSYGSTSYGNSSGTLKTIGTLNIRWTNGSTMWFDADDPDGIREIIMQAKFSQRPRIDNVLHVNTDPTPAGNNSQNQDELLKILKLRFAKGEITKEEFEEMKGML